MKMENTDSYKWRYGWSGSGAPVVTPLMQAIAEKNVSQMEQLFSMGFSWEDLDTDTLQRALYIVVDDYHVMECLVRNGFSVTENEVRLATGLTDSRISDECVSPEGFTSGLCGKAYFSGAYDVLELLVSNGFSAFYCYEKGWAKARKADEEMFMVRDERGIQILMEHGYSVGCDYYEEYVLNRSQVVRKSLGLWAGKYNRTISDCGQEQVPLFFGRSQAKARNKRRREDHEDLLRARRELEQKIGTANFRACQKYKEEKDREMSDILRKLTSTL